MIKHTNKYLNILLGGILMTGWAACNDENDWSTDSAYDRPFSPHNLSVSAEATTATVEFDLLSGVSYILEVSTDTLYTQDYHAGSRIETVETSPYILTGLSGETTYFIRMKAVSSTTAIPESGWSYYVNGNKQSFTTKGEQILNAIETADRGEDRITLSWEAGLEVTHIIVTDGNGEEVATRQITSDEKAQGACTVSGLVPQTSYTFTIYNGTTKRGTRTAATTASMPEANFKYELPASATEISQELLDNLASEAQAAAGGASSYSLTLGIPANAEITFKGGVDATTGLDASLVIPEGMSVTFFGLAGGEKPVLNLVKGINIAGSHGYIRFNNLTLEDSGAQYLVNQGTSSNVEEISFTECNINNLSRSLVRLQGSNAISITNLKIDNCIVSNQGSGNYAFLYFNNAAYTVSHIEITNSTFNGLQHSFIVMSNCNSEGVTIKQCTFYNVVGSGRYLIDANGTNVDITIDKTILGKTYSESARGIRPSGSCTDLYMTTDCVFSSNKITADSSLKEYSSDELFADPANGNFTIQVSGFAGMGDPRWNE